VTVWASSLPCPPKTRQGRPLIFCMRRLYAASGPVEAHRVLAANERDKGKKDPLALASEQCATSMRSIHRPTSEYADWE
jgi:hypothetical protein